MTSEYLHLKALTEPSGAGLTYVSDQLRRGDCDWLYLQLWDTVQAIPPVTVEGCDSEHLQG